LAELYLSGYENANSNVDAEVAELMIAEFRHIPIMKEATRRSTEKNAVATATAEDMNHYSLVAPVVCVMGHVDHGKTSLLDKLRNENRAAAEAGGITQSIGAFKVNFDSALSSLSYCTFLDSPGHAAFRSLRVQVADSLLTDMIICVISAVDGIQPQTVEVLELAKTNSIPLIIAYNKCDLPGINIARLSKDLLQHNIITEAHGGEVLSVQISAKSGEGIDKLKEAIALTAELQQIKARTTGPAKGIIITSEMKSSLGCIINCIIKQGQLKQGDLFVSGLEVGKIREILDENNNNLDTVSPGQSCTLICSTGNLHNLSQQFTVVQSSEEAVQLMEQEKLKLVRQLLLADDTASQATTPINDNIKVSTEAAAEEQGTEAAETVDNISRLRYLVRVDSSASVAAVGDYFRLLASKSDEVAVELVEISIGDINTPLLNQAKMMRAKIIGFNVPLSFKPHPNESQHIFTSDIIYQLMDHIRDAISELLPTPDHHTILGQATIKQVLELGGRKRSEIVRAAGISVDNGVLKIMRKQRNSTKLSTVNPIHYEIHRLGELIWRGSILSMKHERDDVSSLEGGSEGGIVFDDEDGNNVATFAHGDIIHCVETVKKGRVFDDSFARGGGLLPPRTNSKHNDKKKAKKQQQRM
jgi:translation initiation factor IF-2